MNQLNPKKNKRKNKSILMGPKKTPPLGLRESQQCKGRDIKLLKSYIGQENITGYLAAMLHQDGLLDFFGVETDNTSECTSTFANSDYFAVSVKSADGEYFYDLQGQQVPRKVYFKLKQNPATGAISIDQKTYTFDMPEELVGKVPCVVNPETKNCMQGKPPPSEKGRGRPPKTPSAKAASSGGAAGPSGGAAGPSGSDTVQITEEELAGALEKIQIGPRPVSSTGDKPVKLTREEVDSMKDEEVLIDWMIQNVKPQDLLSCIRSGTLTPQETTQLSELEQELRGGVRPSEVIITPEIVAAAEAIADVPPKQAEDILKRLSKADIVARLNQTPPEERTQAVVSLCSRFNILPRQNKKGQIVGFMDAEENVYTVDTALDFCANREAIRLKYQLEKAKMFLQKGIQQRRAQRPGVPPPPPQPQAAGPTTEMLIAEISTLPDDQKVVRLTEIFSLRLPGFESVKLNKRNGKISVITEEDILSLEDAFSGLSMMAAFGRRRRVCRKKTSVQNNFKCAAKKCKGSANYRNCMKKTLRSIYRKRGSRFGAGGCGSPFMQRDPVTGKCVKKSLLSSAKSVAKNTGRAVGAGTIALGAALLSFGKTSKLDDGILPFGRRRRVCRKTSSVVNNFKCAAKKCKGTANYRKCMKTTLRSIYRKRRPVKRCVKRRPVKRCVKRRPVKRCVKRRPVKRCVKRRPVKRCVKRRPVKTRKTYKRKPIRRKAKRTSRNRFGAPSLTEAQKRAMIIQATDGISGSGFDYRNQKRVEAGFPAISGKDFRVMGAENTPYTGNWGRNYWTGGGK